MEEALKDKDGTIETLERQLVQAGIKGKVMQAEMEIQKDKTEIESSRKGALLETEAEQKLLRNVMKNSVDTAEERMRMEVENSVKENEQ
jgi:hypothetical protein